MAMRFPLTLLAPEQLVEVIRVIPQEQMAERVVEQIVDVPMPQTPGTDR